MPIFYETWGNWWHWFSSVSSLTTEWFPSLTPLSAFWCLIFQVLQSWTHSCRKIHLKIAIMVSSWRRRRHRLGKARLCPEEISPLSKLFFHNTLSFVEAIEMVTVKVCWSDQSYQNDFHEGLPKWPLVVQVRICVSCRGLISTIL